MAANFFVLLIPRLRIGNKQKGAQVGTLNVALRMLIMQVLVSQLYFLAKTNNVSVKKKY